MDAGQIIGLIIGVILIGVGVYLVLRSMGYFQYLGGKKRSSIPPVNKETLMGRLLNLSDLPNGFSVLERKNTDLIADWKVLDAGQLAVSGKGVANQAYRAYLLLDERLHAVRCYEETGTIRWVKGEKGREPVVSYRRRYFGTLHKTNHRKGYTPVGEGGSRFGIDRIRQPIISLVRESGWEWVPVIARRHAVYQAKKG